MNEALAGILIAPFLVFLVIVAPVWIIMHYLALSRRERNAKDTLAAPEDRETAARMVGLLEKMEGRIATLEKILDAEDPRWREKRAVNDRL